MLQIKKHIPYVRTRLIASLLLLAALFFPHSARAAIGGAGTSSSPYTINSVADWNSFVTQIDANQNNYQKYWKLTTDINIGSLTNGVGTSTYEFEGVFDGDGHTITYTSTSNHAQTNYVGLFQVTYGENANTVTIKNLKVIAGFLDGKDYSGALIGEVRGSLILDNVHVEQDGLTNKNGWQSGGFIGKFYTQGSWGNTINITNCSYINTGGLNFNSNANTIDNGGFVGYISPNYSSITFKDCLVKLATVTLGSNATPFGCFIGAAHSNVTMIRCVQAGNFAVDASKNRAYIAGWITSGKSITGRASYAYGNVYKGTAGTSTGTISGFISAPSWGNNDYEWQRLERMSDSGASISYSTRGNERWGVVSDVTSHPKLTSTNYSIRLTKGNNISSISKSTNDYNNGDYNYRAANTQYTVTPTTTPNSHQRISYFFEADYNASSGSNYTASVSGNNWLLTPKVNGTVKSNIVDIPYPYTNTVTKANGIDAELKPFDNTISVTWQYGNPNNLTGKFYVYIKESTAGAYTNLTPNGIELDNGSGKAGSYQITNTNFTFNKLYSIYVGYVEGAAPSSPTGISEYNRANVDNFSTTVPDEKLGTWTVSAENGANQIIVKMNGVKTTFTNSTAYSYKVQRRVKLSGTTVWGSYTDLFVNQSFSGVDNYTHNDNGISTPCDAYQYKVIISAFGRTFESEPSNEAHSTGQTAFLADSETPFKASKGEHGNYVRLQWKVNRNGSGTGDVYRVFRQFASANPAAADAWNELEIVTSNAGTVYWNDNNALTGVFYRYKVILYQVCSGSETNLAEKTDIGFTQAFGVVSGRVTYGTGNSVKDVNILVNKTDLTDGEQQYHSLKNDGGSKFEWLADSAYFNTVWTNKNWTLQFWVRPDGTNTGTAIIGYIGGIAVSMTTVTGGYQVYTGFGGSSYKSEIIPAGRFSHIAVTRENNNMKIYTVCDQNQDSIYIKNTAFTYSTATAQTAANSKISFGHALKGNIDDVRFWNKALTEAEIMRDYSRVIVGSENGLKGYWTFDEGLNGYAFDRSRVGTVYNNNHATAVSMSSDGVVPDPTYQLALKGITDANGNYQISGIPYSGEGTSYSIVPSFGVHTFNPQEQLRYVSPTSMVHNATDFTDISAFTVRGQVVYEGGNYPVSDCSFEVDGQTLTMPNGSVVKSDNTGEFEISVPIGQHSVRVVKQGHTFAGGGYLKDENGVDYVYNAPKANVKFQDRTRVKLIGRVVGGTTEDSKPLAFGESKNNIGIQTIELRSTRQAYNFANTPVSETYSHNDGQWRKPSSPLADDRTTVDYNQKNVTIHVSPATGEFSAMVYPEPYDIQPISVTRGGGQTALVIKENAENIDLTAAAVPDASYLQSEIRTWKDSAYIANRPGVVDHWEYSEKSDTVRYNSKWTFMYQAYPTFGIRQIENGSEVDYFGEKTFELKDELSGDTEILALYNEATDTYMFGKPVFRQGKKYELRFNAYEQYSNYVSDPVVTVTYPVIGGAVNLTNNLQVTAVPESYQTDNTGILNYKFTAGAPNLTTAISNIYATLNLGAVSYNWNMTGTGLVADNTTPLEAWQLGEKTTGTNFMTSGPDQLTAILRDPPGTASSAFIEQGTTISSTSTTSTGTTTVEELNLTTSLGPKVTAFIGLGAGVITESEVKLDASVGLSSEQTYSSENEETTTTTFTERFETSSSPDYVGAMGDVFIGNSTNILYGLTNGVKIQKGAVSGNTFSTQGNYKIASSAAISYGQEFATRFAFTAMELEDIMIPKWKNSITERLQPVGTVVNTATIESPVYVSKLEPEDENFGKWNLNKDAFGASPDFNLLKPYDGASYKIYFPASWTPASEPMKNFQDSVLWANNQIGMWEAVLAQNEKEKVEMTNIRNYSFGGGASIQYSEANTSSASYTHTHGFNITPSIGAVIGGDVMGIGMELETRVSIAAESGGSEGESTETAVSTGFTLAEEGTLDEITVDYGMTASGTFAFKTRGGQTSCPYEGEVLTQYYQPGQHILQEATMRVEAPVINVSSANQALNVPANRTAAFTLSLQNESETGDDVWFQLVVDEQSNPNGAELKIDGIGIGNGRTFLVKAGETLTKTLTVGKGTVDDYDNIGIILQSLCDEIADTAWVTAHFIPACPEVAIAAPANNFIVNTETGDILSVTLQNFDVNFPNFGYIRLEQRAAGTPTWSTVRTFYPTNLFNSPTNTDGTKEDIGDRAAIVYDWNMATRTDGQYELRATTASVNINNNQIVGEPLSTYSTVAITGYKDMVKPQAMGAPSPANEIYGAGDELSVTFNEEINTAMVISDNIAATYGANIPVPMTFVTSANKITMEYPSDYFSILEEQTLNITVSDIYDMRGNKSEPISWQAFVNRNALVWDNDPVILVKEAGATLQFTAKIKNAGSGTVSYSLVNLPQWLTASQPTGNLQPLATRELTFTVSSGVNLGAYSEEIGLTSGNQVIKNLPLNLTVTGALPEGWTVNPAGYESTMTVTGRLQIAGLYQTDEADILAAFIGDECVGLASPIKPQASSVELYTFLTIYGNSAHAGQPIKFKIWDASTGNVYSVIESKTGAETQNFTFASNATFGTTAAPVIHNALNMIEQSIALENGWNWVSVNVLNANPAIIQQFKDRIGAAGEMLKGQTGYIQNPNWAGTLTSVDKEKMYIVKTNAATTLHFDGTPAVPAASPITLANGWNWLGYIPQFTLPVNEALNSLTAAANDQIKSHTAYRTYAGAGVGWVGTLNYMRAGEGYMYNSQATAGKTFNYPSAASQIYHAPGRDEARLVSTEMVENHWITDIYKYPNTMTLTSIVLKNNIELQSDLIEIAAFAGDECRGSIMLMNVPQINEHPYLGFLMVFGDGGEAITLKVYDHAAGKEYVASNVVTFAADAIHGTPASPYPVSFALTSIDGIDIAQVGIYPNPVADILNINSESSIEKVTIFDAFGRQIFNDQLQSNSVNVSGLPTGFYTILITTAEGVATRKFVKK